MYLAQDIPMFVMYCVYGESGSSLLIESIYQLYDNNYLDEEVSDYSLLSPESLPNCKFHKEFEKPTKMEEVCEYWKKSEK